MPLITLGYGLILIALGVGGYFMSGGVSMTALIPAFFGLPLAILGLVARKPGARKHAMHVAAVLALLGFGGSFPGLLKLFTLLSGGEVARPAAVYAQSVMAVLSAIFLVLCIRSFIAARKARQAGA
jgi:hypothetical protein